MVNRWSFSSIQFSDPLFRTIEKESRVEHAQVYQLDNLIERALYKLRILITIKILALKQISSGGFVFHVIFSLSLSLYLGLNETELLGLIISRVFHIYIVMKRIMLKIKIINLSQFKFELYQRIKNIF